MKIDENAPWFKTLVEQITKTVRDSDLAHVGCGGRIVYEQVVTTADEGGYADFQRAVCLRCGETSIINEEIEEITERDVCSGCGAELPEEFNCICPRCR